MTPEATRSRRRSRGPWLLCVAAVMVAALCVAAMMLESYANQDQMDLSTARRSRSNAQTPTLRPRSFAGPTSALRRTVVVPTLATPIPLGHNAVWSASLDLAWKQLVAAGSGPVELRDATELCRALNQSAALPSDLDAEDFVAEAGAASADLAERISQRMRERFVGEAVPEMGQNPTSLFAFAFLRVNMDLKEPLTEIKDEVTFHGGDGRETRVWAFGTGHGTRVARDGAPQAVSLFRQDGAYAVDLTGEGDGSYELILARLPRGETLADGCAALERLRAIGKEQAGFPKPLGGAARLIVPEMAWRVTDEVAALKDREVTAPGPWAGRRLESVRHMVELRLDHAGAFVRARAELPTNGDEPAVDGEDYPFTRPFLLMLRRRGQTRPFLVVWVENDELLMRREGSKP